MKKSKAQSASEPKPEPKPDYKYGVLYGTWTSSYSKQVDVIEPFENADDAVDFADKTDGAIIFGLNPRYEFTRTVEVTRTLVVKP